MVNRKGEDYKDKISCGEYLSLLCLRSDLQLK